MTAEPAPVKGGCLNTEIPDSDVDLLVVMQVKGSRRAKQVEVGLAIHDIRISKDIIVVTPEEFEKHRSIVGTIAC